jgi:hypothetical protein
MNSLHEKHQCKRLTVKNIGNNDDVKSDSEVLHLKCSLGKPYTEHETAARCSSLSAVSARGTQPAPADSSSL